MGVNLLTQPLDADASVDHPDVSTEINRLVTKLSACGGGTCPADRTKTITKAACAAVLGSGAVLIK